MKVKLLLATLGLVILGCTKIEVTDQKLPSIIGLTPENVNTKLAVFNLSADSIEFRRMIRNPGKTIFVKGALTYRDENQMEIFNNEQVRVEIKGKSSAYKKMKSLGMLFNQPLDNSTYNILQPGKVVANHNLSNLNAVRFRNSGNDFGETMVKDISYTQLAIQADVDFELMYYRPCHVFVNSRYYGLMNLRTENNMYGMAGLRAVDTGDISLVKIDFDNGNLEWDEGSHEMADKFVNALKKQDAEAIWGMINESSFIDYIIFQDYIGNHDWPHNNTRMYSVKGDPFRFVLYDMDFAAFNTKNAILPEMEYLNDDLSKLYREMRKKSGFDARLKQRQKELYQRLSPEIFNAIVDKNALTIEDEIPYFMAKYGEPESIFHWRLKLDLLKREFRLRDKNIRDKYDL